MQQALRILKPEEYFLEEEPYYESVGDEIAVFEAAYRNGLPVLLKGPTGCGKTRFMEHMTWRLKRALITVSCHDDLTASDLVGRFLVKGGETIWVDGPLTRAVRAGGICYLDEIVEARKDTTVVIHPLADDRRVLPMEKAGELLAAARRFLSCHLLQSGLPKRAQGPQAEHAPALRSPGVRLPGGRVGAADPGEGDRCGPGASTPVGQVRPHDPQPQGPGPRRGCLDATPGPCRQTDRLRRCPGHCLSERHRLGPDRRADMLKAVYDLSASLF